jgi:twinkle protein
MLNVVTGIPSSGKSEWLDQVMLQTIAKHNWHWTVFSPENWPMAHHFHKLAEKWVGKPMFDGYGLKPMDKADVDKTIADLKRSISFIYPPEHDLTVDPILALLLASKEENNTSAFILDPWNELEHNRKSTMSETEYIGQSLTKFRNFGRRHNIAIFIVAHPTKLQKDQDTNNYPVPTPYDISGSANWRNKADGCISVWRNYQENDGVVQIHIQKIRNKNLGKLGQVDLYWHKPNGLFFDERERVGDYVNHGIGKGRI